MALSLLTQQHHPCLLDLPTYFDAAAIQYQQHQQHQQQIQPFTATTNSIIPSAFHRPAKIELTNFTDAVQMELNTSNHYQHLNNNNNRSNNRHTQLSNSGNINQALTNPSRPYMSGYHHQHISADYEPVINFVDSPPNSEESWTDDHSKGSPGPQIIDVQTIYSNSATRKRRMDWDSLDIGQNGNNAVATNAEVVNKSTHSEKDGRLPKKEKLGRGWADDIGFDLNPEFSSNNYLNNESFLSFSPALAVLKQEPQSQQFKTTQKGVLNVHKIDKPLTNLGDSVVALHSQQGNKSKNDMQEAQSGCGSPQSSQASNERHLNLDKNTNNSNSEKCHNACNSVIQQLNMLDASKIDSSTALHAEDHKFQYILAAATSIATKNNEDTLTYLNQGQSYEIKLKKIGDLSFYRDKILKSVIKICFHERRLQFMEREQMQQWQNSRPGERIIEIDVPLSYGLCHLSQPLNPNYLNIVEVFWDPLKEVGVYVKVNCISTEFTPKKHGGEKGVPFRLQIETYIESSSSTSSSSTSSSSAAASCATSQSSTAAALANSPGSPGNLTPTSQNISSNGNLSAALINGKQPVHAAACQIKVFKLKGADRKHKQDREKIQKRPQSEQDKFQPSYECTIMNEIPMDLVGPPLGCFSPEYMKIWPNSPVHIPKYDGMLPHTASGTPAVNTSPIAINSVTSTNNTNVKIMDATSIVSSQQTVDMDDSYSHTIMPESTPTQVAQWLTLHRLNAYLSTFAQFSGSDIMRMSKEDLIQICGLADGIRMFNILRSKAISPRLTLYASLDSSSYNAIYLIAITAEELTQKLLKLPGFYEIVANGGNGTMENGGTSYNNWSMHSKYSGSGSNVYNDVNKSCIYVSGPSGVNVAITNEVLNNEMKDGSLYAIEVQSGKVVMKLINKNDN